LVRHIRTHLKALDRLEQHGYSFPARTVNVLSTDARRGLADRIAAAIDGVSVVCSPLQHEYYAGLRFMINVRTLSGEDIPLIDGGAFDWLHKLASDRKLSYVASGMGSQVAAYVFRTPTPASRAGK
jgi:hypothetical protein